MQRKANFHAKEANIMDARINNWISEPVTVFHETRLPEAALPVGYAALIDAYDLRVPQPHSFCAIGKRHKVYEADGWHLFTPRHRPEATLEGHLVFALRYEGLNLIVLKRLFEVLDPKDLETIIKAKPTGSYMRRIWFLYEWLLDRPLDIPDARTGTYAEIVDPKQQWSIKGVTSTRHRVRNNLPGNRDFCPLVRKTETLVRFVALGLDEQAGEAAAKIPAQVLARTSAFLILKDSKSSYAIEGESPPQNRLQRWGRAIGEAGRHPLDSEELLRLQKIVIGDARFVRLGFRLEGGFVGEHDRETMQPIPAHISARHEDLPELVDGMIAFANDQAQGLDPVIAAAMLAFGFVYIHPFEDGNGRLHRYLIHHVLASRRFNPPDLVFPVSSAILERIRDYERVLESYSSRLLPLIEWEPSARNNVRVLNDTSDFYRYFDATQHAEFLFECVEKTIRHDLPEEAAFLESYDRFKAQVDAIVDLPTAKLDLLHRFLKQNTGVLSQRARTQEFAALTDAEARRIEAIYHACFES